MLRDPVLEVFRRQRGWGTHRRLSVVVLTLWWSACGSSQTTTPPAGPSANRAPVIGSLVVSPTGMGLDSATIFTFTAQGVTDPDGDALTYAWSSSDGPSAVSSSTAALAHVFKRTGTFDVRVTVTDSKGELATRSVPVTIGNLTGTWDVTCEHEAFPLFPRFPTRFVVSITQSGPSLIGTITGSGLSQTFPAPTWRRARRRRSEKRHFRRRDGLQPLGADGRRFLLSHERRWHALGHEWMGAVLPLDHRDSPLTRPDVDGRPLSVLGGVFGDRILLEEVRMRVVRSFLLLLIATAPWPSVAVEAQRGAQAPTGAIRDPINIVQKDGAKVVLPAQKAAFRAERGAVRAKSKMAVPRQSLTAVTGLLSIETPFAIRDLPGGTLVVVKLEKDKNGLAFQGDATGNPEKGTIVTKTTDLQVVERADGSVYTWDPSRKLILTQSGATVSGTFTVTAGVTTVGGNVAGSVAGGNYSGTMTVVNGSSSCPAVVSGTTTDSGRALAWTSAGGFIGDDCRGIEDQGAFVINARK